MAETETTEATNAGRLAAALCAARWADTGVEDGRHDIARDHGVPCPMCQRQAATLAATGVLHVRDLPIDALYDVPDDCRWSDYPARLRRRLLALAGDRPVPEGPPTRADVDGNGETEASAHARVPLSGLEEAAEAVRNECLRTLKRMRRSLDEALAADRPVPEGPPTRADVDGAGQQEATNG